MKSTERAYLAGLIDGEGTISIRTFLWGKQKYIGYQRYVEFVNTDVALMKYFKDRITGGCSRVALYPGRKPVHRHVIVGKAAGALVKVIYPYLIAKKRQAQLLLELQKLQSKWKTAKHRVNYNRDRQHAITAEMKQLNKRGTSTL